MSQHGITVVECLSTSNHTWPGRCLILPFMSEIAPLLSGGWELTLYPQKLALSSPTSCSRSVSIVYSRTQVTELL
jgi:hypothetical protein